MTSYCAIYYHEYDEYCRYCGKPPYLEKRSAELLEIIFVRIVYRQSVGSIGISIYDN